MNTFETNYAALIEEVLTEPTKTSEGRNDETKSVFAETFRIDMSEGNSFPLLVGRKMSFKGIIGEFAAFLHGATCVEDFEKRGCNYWKKWADPDGSLRLDYGNAWTELTSGMYSVNQLANLIKGLEEEPNSRRHLIDTWRPLQLPFLSLPCCHYAYQWYVRDGYLDMIWTQRSVDLMIGLPSDIVLAAIFNIMLGEITGLNPGKITMHLGDCHIYSEHYEKAEEYVERIKNLYSNHELIYPSYSIKPINIYQEFNEHSIDIYDYNPMSSINFELKE